MARQDFFVGRDYLGWRMIPDTLILPGLEVRRHHSYVLFCPLCGEIWARILHEGARYHQLRHVPCLRHGDGRLSPQHDWPDDPTCFEPDWPLPAIKWEFNALLHLAEKEIATHEPDPHIDPLPLRTQDPPPR